MADGGLGTQSPILVDQRMFQFFQLAKQTGGMRAKTCHTGDQSTPTTALMW